MSGRTGGPHPTSTSSYRLKIKYGYQNGQLASIKECANVNCTSTGTNYWTANTFNPRNQITQETLGNGLITARSHDAVTGWLKGIQTGLGGSAGIQQLAYEWDKVGNLKKRRDVNQSNLTEEFFYDNLYRLDYSNLNTVTNLDVSYDALGNITWRSDVGTFTYHGTKKHQVTATSNGWTFGYDNNGNMTSGRGAGIVWTSYNYPASITSGSNTAAFSYTPDRQYWKQVSNYASGGAATTIYVGGLLEKVTTSAGTDFRHLIRAGGSTIVVSRQSTGTNSTHYVTSDHLGSSSAITNSAGAILVNSSFDAFGKRRGSNWSGSPSSGDWSAIAATTRRGYTEHSMLDNLGLIHMNGRVHDPVVGRFLSADPYIADPLDTQNFNRYSYVDNRPLTLTDPSGFVSYRIEFGRITPNNPNTPNGTLPPGAEEAVERRRVSNAYTRTPLPTRVSEQASDARDSTRTPRARAQVPATSQSPQVEMQEIIVCSGCKEQPLELGESFENNFCGSALGCYWANQRYWAREPGLEHVRPELNVFGGAPRAIILTTTRSTITSGAGSAAKAANKLPANARTTIDPQEVYRRLEKFHGIDPAKAGDRLHDIKKSAGLGPADNVVFDWTGNVYDKGGNWLGSLTAGGG